MLLLLNKQKQRLNKLKSIHNIIDKIYCAIFWSRLSFFFQFVNVDLIANLILRLNFEQETQRRICLWQLKAFKNRVRKHQHYLDSTVLKRERRCSFQDHEQYLDNIQLQLIFERLKLELRLLFCQMTINRRCFIFNLIAV